MLAGRLLWDFYTNARASWRAAPSPDHPSPHLAKHRILGDYDQIVYVSLSGDQAVEWISVGTDESCSARGLQLAYG